MAQANVQATVMADNGAIVVLQLGGSYAIVPDSVGSNWPTANTFNFTVPSDAPSLSRCDIHVIAWGDGSAAQGIMAHFSSTGGFSYTGQGGGPLDQVRQSSVVFAGGTANGLTYATNLSNVAGIIQGATLAPQQYSSAPLLMNSMPWTGFTPPVGLQDRGNIKMVWNGTSGSLGRDPNNFRVISLPCANIVRSSFGPPPPPPPPPPPAPPAPQSGDHFQCYRVTEPRQMERQSITVADQFGRQEVVIVRPIMVCNPAVKTHDGRTHGVENPDRHMVCYEAERERRPQQRRVVTNDQFAVQTLDLGMRDVFCAPAGKNRIDAPEVPLPDSGKENPPPQPRNRR